MPFAATERPNSLCRPITEIGAGLLWEEPKRSVLLALVFAVVLALSPLLFSP
jgi:hypothetical protein